MSKGRRELIRSHLEHGPFGTLVLRGYDRFRNETFSSQAFASQMNEPHPRKGQLDTCWTAAGKVRCKGGITFPRTDGRTL